MYVHLIQHLFVKQHHRNAQVWHVFSRDLTVLPAHPHVQSAIGINHTCLCLLNCSWYSFTDSGWIEGRVGLPTDGRFYYFAG